MWGIAGSVIAAICGIGMAAQTNEAAGLDEAVRTAQGALSEVATATSALDRQDPKGAQTALDLAASALRQLYTAVPGARALQQLAVDGGEVRDFGPLLTEIRADAAWMDPEVIALVEKAARKVQVGDRAGAAAGLARARRRLIEDLGILPIEDVYARVQAARGELHDGHADDARRLLNNLPLLMARVGATAPLVPVRLNLRLAASAIAEGNLERGSELITRATAELEKIADSLPPEPFDRTVKPLIDRAHGLQRHMANGQRPRPRDLRDFATRLRSLDPTS
jgi:hypothetical protein